MPTRHGPTVHRSEITDKRLYVGRREFIRAATGSAVAAAAGVLASAMPASAATPAEHGPKLPNVGKSPFSITETPTPWDAITTYNNFYEFGGSDNKELPSRLAPLSLVTDPWVITVDGFCEKPGEYPLEDVLKDQALEERIYRHRCVEGWSMVIPWVGFPLGDFIKRCAPTSKATFVEFNALYDPDMMPMTRRLPFRWPFTEGLRMDEAMHPLAILAVGLYGEALPYQDGAPIRVVVPWKYGFKSIKSIVRIAFVDRPPLTTYQDQAPRDYGFYSNVNPNVPHPRWSQATERRIGEFLKRKTLMFNGYGNEVAKLYGKMDLKKYF